ncbi:bifunctional oligoribonuclease/PAP phosphatase NrnA [Patescibacteria group bacterium]|nr:bifunctional oligoribonuclease/PAP phosphatase NrnA [Patescibacteria group bacterium]
MNKKIAAEIWQEIQKAKRILLHLHPSPDGDSLGAALAMWWMLRGLGKEVDLIKGDSSPPKYLSSLPGFGEIKLWHYDEVETDKYDLFIILDSMDITRVSNFGTVEFPNKLMTVVIDHHALNTRFGKINLVDGKRVATSEILFDLFTGWKVPITKEMAINLMVGMYTDSGGFKYELVNWKTFRAAEKLAKIAPDFTRFIFELENNNEPDRIKFIGLALNNIKLYFSHQVAVSMVSFEQLQQEQIEAGSIDKAYVSGVLKSVSGWNVGIAMAEKDKGVVGVSLRTRDPNKWDVAKIALATGFGGGHATASGATIKSTTEEAKDLILGKIKELYPELGEP